MQGLAHVLGGVDHVGGNDQVVVPGPETLLAGGFLQVELGILDKIVLAELFFGAAAEQRGNVREAITHIGDIAQFREQPGGGATGAAPDFQNTQRPASGVLMFVDQPGDHTCCDLIEIAAEAELLIQHFNTAGGAFREDHRHRLHRTAHHGEELLAGSLDGVGDHVQPFTATAQLGQQCRALFVGDGPGAAVTAVIKGVIAVLDTGIEQAHQQLPMARQQPAPTQDTQRFGTLIDARVHTLTNHLVNINGMQLGHAVIQALQAWQVQIDALLHHDLATGLQQQIRRLRDRLLLRIAPVALLVKNIQRGMDALADRGQQGAPRQGGASGEQAQQAVLQDGGSWFMAAGTGDPVHAGVFQARADAGQWCIGTQFQRDCHAGLQRVSQCLVIAHRLTQVPAPVIAALKLGMAQRLASQGRDQRYFRRGRAQSCTGLLEFIENRVQQARVRRAGHAQVVMPQVSLLQRLRQCVDGVAVTGGHQMLLCVMHGDFHPVFKRQRLQRCRVAEHREH